MRTCTPSALRPGFLRNLRGLARHVFPGLDARCHACAMILRSGEDLLCRDCAEALHPRLRGYCPLCGEMSDDPTAPLAPCPACRTEARPWDGLALHGPYEGLLRELILQFKFRNRLDLTALLGDLAVQACRRAGFERPDAVTAVPLHPERLRWRGYNQALELARAPVRHYRAKLWPEAIIRIRATAPQMSLNREERQRNLDGAFIARPEQVRGRCILLVDDISTTGRSLTECAQALKSAGAVKVLVLLLAKA